MVIGLEIMPLKCMVPELCDQMYENGLFILQLTFKVMPKVIHNVTIRKVVGNYVGIRFEIVPLIQN